MRSKYAILVCLLFSGFWTGSKCFSKALGKTGSLSIKAPTGFGVSLLFMVKKGYFCSVILSFSSFRFSEISV